MVPAYVSLCFFNAPLPLHLKAGWLTPRIWVLPASPARCSRGAAPRAFSSPSCPPSSGTNKQMGTSETKTSPCFLPAHHPPKAIIRDVLCGGLEVILGGGLVIQQGPTAGLAVSLLAQAVGEGIVPGEERDMSWRWVPSSEEGPGHPEILHSCLHTPVATPAAPPHTPAAMSPLLGSLAGGSLVLHPYISVSFPFSSLFS